MSLMDSRKWRPPAPLGRMGMVRAELSHAIRPHVGLRSAAAISPAVGGGSVRQSVGERTEEPQTFISIHIRPEFVLLGGTVRVSQIC